MDQNINQPQTIIAERAEQKSNPNYLKFLNPKIIFLILGGIILVEVFFGVNTLFKSSSSPAPVQQKTVILPTITNGSMSLSSLSTSVKVGGKLVVSVDVSTGGNEVLGADAILHYNPKLLSLTKADIKTGLAFSSYPLVEVDGTKGIIWISGVAEGQNFKGDANLAVITFTAKAPGVENVSIEYKDNETRDSNLVSSEGVDVLKRTKDLNIEIIK